MQGLIYFTAREGARVVYIRKLKDAKYLRARITQFQTSYWEVCSEVLH